ncbi:hypothetical protein [Dyadobacter jiangsuensis]|uniref:Lipoprotein n=1 Tax=Dyadobacter jiangsuensis TaxID=1591085 RepID=A0A2P8F8M2_9BACT|nr:hypothetical protein [Dyadobacter jiangsuensis]PSL18067.1 hypothetical protein CLV60_13315 [Dyadobacter jiangsuensis]
MSNSTRVVVMSLAVAALAVGCSQPDVKSTSNKTTPSSEQFESEIALLEKEAGKTYFKKDIVISDKDGKNQVTIQFASEDQTVLNNYLDEVQYEVVPVYKGQSPQVPSQNTSPSNSANTNHPSLATNKFPVFTEERSRNLQAGVVGFFLSVKSKSQAGSKVLAREGYAYTSNHISGEDWSEKLHFIRNHNGPNNNIHYFLKCKDGGLFASWYTPPTLHNILNGPGGQLPNDFFLTYPGGVFPGVDVVYDIDGPKKHQLVVDHNGYTDYSYYFENY